MVVKENVSIAQKNHNFIKFIEVNEKCTPGKARNIGFDNSNGEIIIHSDADDLYHPMRNEIIARAFREHNCDIVLHSYHKKNSRKSFLHTPNYEKINYKSLSITNLKNKKSPLAYGHASFKRSVLEKIKYNTTLVPKEDSEILNRAEKENKKFICIDVKLSSWNPSWSWRPLDSDLPPEVCRIITDNRSSNPFAFPALDSPEFRALEKDFITLLSESPTETQVADWLQQANKDGKKGRRSPQS